MISQGLGNNTGGRLAQLLVRPEGLIYFVSLLCSSILIIILSLLYLLPSVFI